MIKPTEIVNLRQLHAWQLNNDSVAIFLININSFEQCLNDLRNTLALEEKQKADRFHFPVHRKRYIISQGLLRVILAEYLKISAENITFDKNYHGKPYLKDINTSLEFNISHSEDYAVYAFSKLSPIGIDIEHWRDRKFLSGIIDSNFSKLEQDIYHNLPSELQVASFYRGWTCNEAFIKAIGMGLSFPLDNFSVEMDPRKPAKLLHAKPYAGADIDWKLQDLAAPANYSLALASKIHAF